MALSSPVCSAVIADEGTLSGEVDLHDTFAHVAVFIPAIDSATVTIHIAYADTAHGGTYLPLHLIRQDTGGSTAYATTAGTGGIVVSFPMCGCQYVKVKTGAAQNSGPVTFYLVGYDDG